jgi:hypothetical protein
MFMRDIFNLKYRVRHQVILALHELLLVLFHYFLMAKTYPTSFKCRDSLFLIGLPVLREKTRGLCI